jgi:hypothetical protein
VSDLDNIGMTEFEIVMEVAKKNRKWKMISESIKSSIYHKYVGRSPIVVCIPDMWWRTLDDLDKVRISEF